MKVPPVWLAVLLTIVVAGCLADGGPVQRTSEAPDSPSDAPVDPGWPRQSEAAIRPGVTVGGLSCTSGFLFQSPDNATLYLSAAGHCFPDKEEGASVEIHGGAYTGRLVYSHHESFVEKDFALIALNNSYRDEVHPAVLHYGGPTGMAENVSRGDRVVTFGNSSLREPVDSMTGGRAPASPGNEIDARGGVVYSRSQYETEGVFAPPSIHGDSGSPVTTEDGRAVGWVTTLTVGGCGACNKVANLDANLELAREAGIDASLVTWPTTDADWPSAQGADLPTELVHPNQADSDPADGR